MKFDGHRLGVKSVSFSPDGTTLVSGSIDRSSCIWDVKTGRYKFLLNNSSRVYSVCFSPNGILATGSRDRSVSLWDIKAGQNNFG